MNLNVVLSENVFYVCWYGACISGSMDLCDHGNAFRGPRWEGMAAQRGINLIQLCCLSFLLALLV